MQPEKHFKVVVSYLNARNIFIHILLYLQDDEKMDFGDPFTEIPGKKRFFVDIFYILISLFFALTVFEAVSLHLFSDSASSPPETPSGTKHLIHTSDLKPSYDDLAHIFDSDDSDRDDPGHVSA